MHPLHHIELWTHDLAAAAPSFDWLLGRLGWRDTSDPTWAAGRTWQHPSGLYLVLEQSPAVVGRGHDRLRPGLNHLALNLPPGSDGRARLDDLRSDAPSQGWSELFGEDYPHAGGPSHTALFLENEQGFEVEIVVP
ncbi:VOC family protein [Brachybacterium endophyticum]|uniref:VOC family protein n=1 Tax=Brachybacterium endophyticum TaxID=2182385 RepID=UPI001F0C7C79|nr:VOC family protein [Brachybacterium endophyticum]